MKCCSITPALQRETPTAVPDLEKVVSQVYRWSVWPAMAPDIDEGEEMVDSSKFCSYTRTHAPRYLAIRVSSN